MAAVPTDPYSAGLMAVASIANSPPPSSNAQSSTGNITFDNSGWAVNVGGTGTTANTSKATPAGAAVQAVASTVGGLLSNPVVLVALGVGLILYLKQK
jgi:hypothetical protein